MDKHRFDPQRLGERSKRAYDAITVESEYYDGQWHPWPDVIETMLAGSDLKPASCATILRCMAHKGEIMRHGTYRHPHGATSYDRSADTREVLFLDIAPHARTAYSDEEWVDVCAWQAEIARLRGLLDAGEPLDPLAWQRVATRYAWTHRRENA